MYKLEFISAKGSVLPLTSNSRFKLANVDGLTTASVNLSSTTISGMDGDFVNEKRTIPRGIVLDLAIENDVENVKRYILQYVKPKQRGILRMTQDDRETQITGIVETIEMPRYSSNVTMQISLYCSYPYWEDVEYIIQEISEIINLHYFTDYPDDMLYFPEDGIPFGEYDENRTQIINNEGDVAVGMEIHIIAIGNVTNPVIYNSSGEYIGVDMSLTNNDEVIINTSKGQKTVTVNGESKISKLRRGSTWLQVETGENEFTIDSEDGTEANMYFNIIYKQSYV